MKGRGKKLMTSGRWKNVWLRVGLALIVGVLVSILPRSASARPGGIFSGEFTEPAQGCLNCHGPARGCDPAPPFPTVRLECSGATCPTTLVPNQEILTTLVIARGPGDTRSSGGLHVSVTGGATLAPNDASTKTITGQPGSELTHTAPRSGANEVRFDFKLKMPGCGTAVKVNAWGNIVNVDSSVCGDAPAKMAEFTINTTLCANGQPCTIPSQCASGLCFNQVCAPTGQQGGASCSTPQQCASSNCLDNRCCTQSSCPGPTGAQQCYDRATCFANGNCGLHAKPNGSSCSDGQACTTGDNCVAGSCVSEPVRCESPDPSTCRDPASGSCTSTGACIYELPAPEGQPCTVASPDPNQSYSCRSGGCVGEAREGTAWLWGSGESGQLGHGQSGTGMQSALPVLLAQQAGVAASFPTDVISVATGSDHTLALTVDGSVWAWGNNDYGQLGDDTTTARSRPVEISSLHSRVIAIAAGSYHSLALFSDGTVYAWGRNDHQEIGDPSWTGSTKTPRLVPGLTNVIALEAGNFHSVALKADGTIVTWGNNQFGQLGNNTSYTSPAGAGVTTVAIGSVRFRAIAAGQWHNLALAVDGRVYAWGGNQSLALGRTGTAPALAPVVVAGLSAIRGIAAGGFHSLALGGDGSVWAWGDNNDGEMGNGTLTPSAVAVPAKVPGLSAATAIACGTFNNAVVLGDGSLWTWGGNGFGQLGDASRPVRDPKPKPISGVRDAQLVSLGRFHAAFVRPLNSVRIWGGNGHGRLGIGKTFNQRNTADTAEMLKKPPELRTVKAIATTGGTALTGCAQHSLIVAGDGSVWMWGDGTGFPENVLPRRVWGLPPVIAAAAGCNVSAALAADGTVWTWGDGAKGTLGDGTTAFRATPAKVPGIASVRAIALRDQTLMALTATGSIFTWGSNFRGSTPSFALAATGGNRTTVPTTAVSLPGGKRARSVTAGPHNGFAILENGTLAAWGYNQNASLGLGNSTTTATPTLVLGGESGTPTLGNLTSVAVGEYVTLATVGGFVYGWGNNNGFQLGTLQNVYFSPILVLDVPWLKQVASGQSASQILAMWGQPFTAGLTPLGHPRPEIPGFEAVQGITTAAAIEMGSDQGMAIVPGPAAPAEYKVMTCAPDPPLLPPTGAGPGNTCKVFASPTTPSAGLLLRGDVLAPDTVYRGGEVLVDGTGTIQCVGCSCSTHPSYARATRVDCAQGVISPGLVNPHEHLGCWRGDPTSTVFQTYEFRDDWRPRIPDPDPHATVAYSCTSTEDQVTGAEMRHVLAGTTSIVGNGSFSAPGLLRNLDQMNIADLKAQGRDHREGVLARVVAEVFPLLDSFEIARPDLHANPGSWPLAEAFESG